MQAPSSVLVFKQDVAELDYIGHKMAAQNVSIRGTFAMEPSKLGACIYSANSLECQCTPS